MIGTVLLGTTSSLTGPNELSAPAVKSARFPLAAYVKEKKRQEKLIVNEKILLSDELDKKRLEVESKHEDLSNLIKSVHAAEEKIRRKRKKEAELKDSNERPTKAVRISKVPSRVQKNSDKLVLSSAQSFRRRNKTLDILKPIHCAGNNNNIAPVLDGMWATLVATATKEQMRDYINNSNLCSTRIIPEIVKKRVKQFEFSQDNEIRSIKMLYQGGILSKKKYSTLRNCTDVAEEAHDHTKVDNNYCEIPKIVPYKKLMKIINSVNIGEVQSLETLVDDLVPSGGGIYRPLEPFLLRLADLYLSVHEKQPCLHWFHGKINVFYVAVGADGAPFGKDNTATAYLVSFLNLLQRIQSCNDNHLLLGANCEEDSPLLKKYTNHLACEMEAIEGQKLKTTKGYEVVFMFELIPSDMKWVSTMSGELSNSATYFSPYANVSQDTKGKRNGCIGGATATWQPWDYNERLSVAKKVEVYKKTLKDPQGKQRSHVTKFISKNKSRQEFIPPLKTYVNKVKAEPLHNTNNAWQHWFVILLTLATHCCDKNMLKSFSTLANVPKSYPLIRFLECIKHTVKCGRLFKSYSRWFNEKRKSGISFSYRFTGLESKRFCWNFTAPIKILLQVPNLSKGSYLKLHTLAFTGGKLRDAVAIYTRVDTSKETLQELNCLCKSYFNAVSLLLKCPNPTVWTVGYAIPYHSKQLYDTLGYGLGLNSMQGREAKHIKLKQYVANTCSARRHQQWWTVFRHEFISMIWLRERDPLSVVYRGGKQKESDSYIPIRVARKNTKYCYCGEAKVNINDNECHICNSDIMKLVRKSVDDGEVNTALLSYLND